MISRRNFLKTLTRGLIVVATPKIIIDMGANTWRNSYDAVLIKMFRRNMPHLMAYDVFGVQPMKSPENLIFTLKTHIEIPPNDYLT